MKICENGVLRGMASEEITAMQDAAALYDEWSVATNWATYASYMVAV